MPEETTEKSEKIVWPEGKRAAVSLTFDDARPSQIDNGIPLFARYGVNVTFYLSPENIEKRLEGWKNVTKTGHEIGNHTMTHPCTGNYPFSRENALEEYTLEKIKTDIETADREIQKLLGVTTRTFAYPCGQKFVGRGAGLQSYVPIIAEKFIAGRGWLDENTNDPAFCDMARLLAMESDGKSFEQLKQLVDNAAADGRWLILCGHDINDGGRQTTLITSLEQLCEYCQNPDNGIWIDTVENICNYIIRQRNNNKRQN
ncbi:polysaccharide deacetylase family protein [candidate division KSB1 bacterium]|nr:polysaccharide deacetylase family protein [candidate division KSB1 bacterium]